MSADVTPCADGDRGLAGATLVGRDAELEIVRAVVGSGGGSLVFAGERGVGKTTLLDAAVREARRSGTRILRADGAQFEDGVCFAGLNQLLLPLADELGHMPPPLRTALLAALGLTRLPIPDRPVVCDATMDVLRRAGSSGPLLVVIDDLQCVDPSSAEVLGPVTRRLEGTGVGFLGARLSGTACAFAQAGVAEVELPPLDDEPAGVLVNRHFPTLALPVQQRILAEAGGNPLVLLELPLALSETQRTGAAALPAVLPLSTRLGGLFATQLAGLASATQWLLLIAAVEGSGDLQRIGAIEPGLAGLADAERAGVVRIDPTTGRLLFAHLLLRSAIVAAATHIDRQRAHKAVADALTDAPERRAYHLGEASDRRDNDVADLLDHAAQLALTRGDTTAAVAGLTRAAELSLQPDVRSGRLARAAFIDGNLGEDFRLVRNVLADARRTNLPLVGSLHAAAATALLLLNGDGDVEGAQRLLVEAITARNSDDDLLDALNVLHLVCQCGGRAELWEPFDFALGHLPRESASKLRLVRQLVPNPIGATPAALADLSANAAELPNEIDPWMISQVGAAAVAVDRGSLCRDALWRVVRRARRGESVTCTIKVISLLCRDDMGCGRWDEAERLAQEALSLCETQGNELLRVEAWVILALVAAQRGDTDAALWLTQQVVRWAAPRGFRSSLLAMQQARGVLELGRGNFEAAYRHLTKITLPGRLPPYVPSALLTVMDLVEAAVRTGRYTEAAAHVEAAEAAGAAAISPRLALIVAGSAAMAAHDMEAAPMFEHALATPDAEGWPFELARVELMYGERLRRARATTESREHLGAAFETFARLGAHPWASRAATELRAAGGGTGRPKQRYDTSLTAQEREIASLAAAGLTNKEIAARLCLSHRTVSAHLYRIFPKLAITSRAALRDALEGLEPVGAPSAVAAGY
jgi:DNA-binding CsgD family transcriptional regulator